MRSWVNLPMEIAKYSAREVYMRGVSIGRGLLARSRNIIICNTQSINRLRCSTHDYPSTAAAEWANEVRRNEWNAEYRRGFNVEGSEM